MDSVVVRTTCLTPSGAACGQNTPAPTFDIDFYWSATTDSATGTVVKNGVGDLFAADASTKSFAQNAGDSMTVSNSGTGAATSFTWSAKARTGTSAAVGTYAITFFLQGSNNGAAVSAANANSQSVTWNVTVSALSTTVSSLNTYVAGVYSDVAAQNTIGEASAQAAYYKDFVGAMQSSKESAIVFATTAADAQTPVAAGVVYAYALNSAGETFTATGTVNICASGCAITAVIEGGPGLLSNGLNSGTKAKSVSITYTNNRNANTETLTVYADGTPGTSTLKFYNGSTLVKSHTLTFTGTPASATSVSLADTAVAVSATGTATTTTLRAVIKDSAGSVLRAGTVYVWASDTNVVRSGAVSSNAAQYTQFAAGLQGSTAGACTTYDATLGQFSCTVGISDTGTSTLLFSDSWTVAASTWTSSAVTVTGHGRASTYAITFDKTSYTAGEQAIITLTGKDLASRPATTSKNSLTVTTSMGLGNGGSTLAGSTNTAAAFTGSRTYTPKKVVGGSTYETSETFVVLMPATSGTFKVTVKTTPESTSSTQTEVEYTGSVTVVNPAEVAANAATAAAEAASDAAAEAIDAANAATDAANLAAEAADAATVAAEEARDAADAATAAVEELATQVATLMAALKAQITTLANTVAKIAKKVKA
jgi:hypothetical protein